MLKKTITYENLFTEETMTEEHYFHISKADMVEMEVEDHKDEYTSKDGQKLTGAAAKFQRIVDSEDGRAIMIEMKDMIRRSYGKKDGSRFLKSKEISDEFLGSEAFSQLLFELCTDATAAADFINGVFPGNLEAVIAEVQERAARSAELEKVPTSMNGNEANPPRILTEKEMREMPSNELQSGLADGRYKLS